MVNILNDMMNKVSDILVSIVAAPPERRGDHERELLAILPIIMMKTTCFRGIDRGTVIDILKKATHEQYHEDGIIIKQVEPGDRFYIIIRGSVSVYVDHRLGDGIDVGEELTPRTDADPTPRTEPATARKEVTKEQTSSRHDDMDKDKTIDREAEPTRRHGRDGKKDPVDPLTRKRYGQWISTLSRNQCFGELALLNPGGKRTATVVADECTDLLAISHDVFHATLKENFEKDLEEKRIFVRTHPFFSRWSLPQQRHLLWSLKKTTYKLGAHYIRQGDQTKGLHFLISGRARLTAEPGKHRQQFPEVFGQSSEKPSPKPILREDSTLSDIVTFKRYEKSNRMLSNMDPFTYIRRTDGYAVAEKVVFDKLVDLCIIEEGEVLGDFELLLGLDQNIFSVICSSSCTFYSLSQRVADRLILKKNPHTLNMLKLQAETKVSRRMTSTQGRRMTILSPLLFRILNIRVVDPNATEAQDDQEQLAPKSQLHNYPKLPQPASVERQRTVLIEWFLQGKTPLLQPITNNAIYYREMIQKRAKVREVERLKGPQGKAEYRSLGRRVQDAFMTNFRDQIKMSNTMRKLRNKRSELTPVTRWK